MLAPEQRRRVYKTACVPLHRCAGSVSRSAPTPILDFENDYNTNLADYPIAFLTIKIVILIALVLIEVILYVCAQFVGDYFEAAIVCPSDPRFC